MTDEIADPFSSSFTKGEIGKYGIEAIPQVALTPTEALAATLQTLVVEGKGVDVKKLKSMVVNLKNLAPLVDSDNDGKVTREEFGVALRKLQLADKTITAALSPSVITDLVKTIPPEGLGIDEINGQFDSLNEKLDAADKDGNGYYDGSEIIMPITNEGAYNYEQFIKEVSEGELSKPLKIPTGFGQFIRITPAPETLIGAKLVLDTVPKDIDKLDLNGDGGVSLSELKQQLFKSIGMDAGQQILHSIGLDKIPDGDPQLTAPLQGIANPLPNTEIDKTR